MTSEDTIQLGRLIGANAPGGTVIALRGGLGAGKTTLCKGIGEGLGIREEITSPTYTIISEYEGRLKFFHMDAYRLDSLSDFRETGGLDMLGMPDSLCAMEWSERLPEIAKDDTTLIEIHVGEDGSREFSIKGKWLEDLLA
ncbi:MAG: tRNA (adenosine(37)-N6)-threonylcarbamoyltransferase complex ATPase subunit type 1 TsaE [Spirochaetaceae bacterium]|nr:tRNA (adenosine(37)-N6)-threonylcarbamoyltransferase complex ATPase subunit type 1 TsaE [Spirochaetaceae bacterium]